MEHHPTPFPVRSQYMNPKSTRKIPGAPMNNKKVGPPLTREKRVFGTARNPNIPFKTGPAKAKPSSGALKNSAKPSQQQTPPTAADTKSSSRKNPARPKNKKSVCFQENEVSRNEKFSVDGDDVEPQTPAKSPAVQAKHRLSITPYRSAERCSKCRFDKLETSSYWLSQVKLAEAVGKHFVSAAFFRLAFDCQAEPIRNIRVELKKYMARHEYLNEEDEWKKLTVSYGLVKEENSVDGREVKANTDEENASDHNHEDK